LREVGELCLRLARLSGEKAEAALAAPDPAPAATAARVPDPVLAFARLTRAVRMTVGLHARLRTQAQLRRERRAADAAERAAETAEALEDRRRTGRLRRAMTRFIVSTALEAEERDPRETDRLVEALDARLAAFGADDADLAALPVKDAARALAEDLGIDPGPDWWRDGWGIEPAPRPPPTPAPHPPP
jgi:hypothetical protein